MSEREGSQRERGARRAGRSELARVGLSEERAVRPGPAPRYRWVVLVVGVVAQAAFSAVSTGLPAVAPALRSHYGLTIAQLGVALAAAWSAARNRDGATEALGDGEPDARGLRMEIVA